MDTPEAPVTPPMDQQQAQAYYRMGANVLHLSRDILPRRQHQIGASAALVALQDIDRSRVSRGLPKYSHEELAGELDGALEQIRSKGMVPLRDDFVKGFDTMRITLTTDVVDDEE